MIVAGIDPGIHGGLAIIAVEDDAAPRLVEAIDIPVIGTAAKERVDAIAIREWVSKHDVQHAFIERAQAMPQQGSSNGFKYGRAVGAIEATIALSGISGDRRRAIGLEAILETPRQRQGRQADALTDLVLTRDDLIAETMRPPRQVELKGKARGLKIPAEFIVSTRSGTSLVRAENARVPMPGRDELVRLFSQALETLHERGRT